MLLCVSHKVWTRIWDKLFIMWPYFSQSVHGEVVGLLEHYMPTLQDFLDAWRWCILLLVKKHVHIKEKRYIHVQYILYVHSCGSVDVPLVLALTFLTLYFFMIVKVCGGSCFPLFLCIWCCHIWVEGSTFLG